VHSICLSCFSSQSLLYTCSEIDRICAAFSPQAPSPRTQEDVFTPIELKVAETVGKSLWRFGPARDDLHRHNDQQREQLLQRCERDFVAKLEDWCDTEFRGRFLVSLKQRIVESVDAAGLRQDIRAVMHKQKLYKVRHAFNQMLEGKCKVRMPFPKRSVHNLARGLSHTDGQSGH
jgi:hypothetical protein